MKNQYKANGNDYFSVWGVEFRPGTYNELLKRAQPKGGFVRNWPDEHGTQRDLSARYFESIEYSLPIYIKGNSQFQLLTFYDNLANFHETAGYFDFDVIQLNRRYKMLCLGLPDVKKLNSVLLGNGLRAFELTLHLVNDFPTERKTIPV